MQHVVHSSPTHRIRLHVLLKTYVADVFGFAGILGLVVGVWFNMSEFMLIVAFLLSERFTVFC